MKRNQKRVYLETRLRNLKRKYSKISAHPDLVEEAIELKADIDNIERELYQLR